MAVAGRQPPAGAGRRPGRRGDASDQAAQVLAAVRRQQRPRGEDVPDPPVLPGDGGELRAPPPQASHHCQRRGDPGRLRCVPPRRGVGVRLRGLRVDAPPRRRRDPDHHGPGPDRGASPPGEVRAPGEGVPEVGARVRPVRPPPPRVGTGGEAAGAGLRHSARRRGGNGRSSRRRGRGARPRRAGTCHWHIGSPVGARGGAVPFPRGCRLPGSGPRAGRGVRLDADRHPADAHGARRPGMGQARQRLGAAPFPLAAGRRPRRAVRVLPHPGLEQHGIRGRGPVPMGRPRGMVALAARDAAPRLPRFRIPVHLPAARRARVGSGRPGGRAAAVPGVHALRDGPAVRDRRAAARPEGGTVGGGAVGTDRAWRCG